MFKTLIFWGAELLSNSVFPVILAWKFRHIRRLEIKYLPLLASKRHQNKDREIQLSQHFVNMIDKWFLIIILITFDLECLTLTCFLYKNHLMWKWFQLMIISLLPKTKNWTNNSDRRLKFLLLKISNLNGKVTDGRSEDKKNSARIKVSLTKRWIKQLFLIRIGSFSLKIKWCNTLSMKNFMKK